MRDVVERMIPNPTAEDIAQLRAEAEDAAVAAGAARESVEVDVSVDSQRNIVRAAASGATELRTRDLRRAEAGEDERRTIAAESMRTAPDALLSWRRARRSFPCTRRASSRRVCSAILDR